MNTQTESVRTPGRVGEQTVGELKEMIKNTITDRIVARMPSFCFTFLQTLRDRYRPL